MPLLQTRDDHVVLLLTDTPTPEACRLNSAAPGRQDGVRSARPLFTGITVAAIKPQSTRRTHHAHAMQLVSAHSALGCCGLYAGAYGCVRVYLSFRNSTRGVEAPAHHREPFISVGSSGRKKLSILVCCRWTKLHFHEDSLCGYWGSTNQPTNQPTDTHSHHTSTLHASIGRVS